MKIRKNILPRTLTDIGCCLLLSLGIPVTFIFEITVLLPEFHEYGSPLYIMTLAAGIFLVFNIKTNMLTCMFTDTSIKHEVLDPPTDTDDLEGWRFCSTCESYAPPRSWHCVTCKTCILKRDHHCMFTGCCIGHRNHRYFMMLLIYLFIGTAYTTAYNSVYIWWFRYNDFVNFTTILKLVCPMLMFTLDTSAVNLFLLIYMLNIIGFLQSVVLLVYHWKIISHGAVVFERKAPKFNLGLKRNLEMVFGKRWYLVWLSPFISSELPCDGIHWEQIMKESDKMK